MIFNQLEFLLLFLPVVVALFVALPNWRCEMLIFASFIFYGISGVDHAAILLFVSTWTWVLCRTDAIVGNRSRLVVAILPAVLALAFYKYLGFMLETVGFTKEQAHSAFSLFGNIVLPAGISFFTFHLVAYAIDRYRRTLPIAPSYKDFLLFMSFFPHLVAGPILRFADVAGSLRSLPTYRISGDATARFLGHLATGLALKVLIADTLGAYISRLTSNLDAVGAAAGAFIVFAYSFQIYFDFFGYSLIAIGLGALFGFTFPRNFDDPYKSLDIREFWRRWHMTLSFWIRDYLYLPLGGNRAYVRNILIVFAVCGLWHGAGWNFVAWGLAHGILVAGYHYGRKFWDALPAPLRMAATFTIVSLLWLLFLFDFSKLSRFLAAIGANGFSGVHVTAEMWVMLAFAGGVCFIPRLQPLLDNRLTGMPVARNVFLGAMMVISLVFMDRSDTFIYFRF